VHWADQRRQSFCFQRKRKLKINTAKSLLSNVNNFPLKTGNFEDDEASNKSIVKIRFKVSEADRFIILITCNLHFKLGVFQYSQFPLFAYLLSISISGSFSINLLVSSSRECQRAHQRGPADDRQHRRTTTRTSAADDAAPPRSGRHRRTTSEAVGRPSTVEGSVLRVSALAALSTSVR